MRRLLPYIKLLKPVRLQFALAILCALIYGLSSGFGLPFMSKVVFPLIFEADAPESAFFVQTADEAYLPVELKGDARIPGPVAPGLEAPEIASAAYLSSDGRFFLQADNGERETVPNLYRIFPDGSRQEIAPTLFGHDASSDSYFPLEAPENGETERNPWLLIGVVALLPLVFLLRGLSGFFNVYLIALCGIRVLEDVRLQVFSKLQNLPLAFFQKEKSGDILSRVLGDTAALQNAVTMISNDIVKQPITLLGAIGFLIYQATIQKEVSFILLSFLVIGICILPIRYIGKQMLKKVTAMQAQLGDLSATVNENLSATREVRAFNLEDRETKRFQKSVQQFLRIQLKVVKYSSSLNPAIEFISACGISAAVFYAANKGITLTDIIPLVFALYMSYEPVKKLGKINNEIRRGMASVDRLEYILNQPDTLPDPRHPVPFPHQLEAVTFENVDFAYEQGAPTLKQIDLTIAANEVVALVGPSGAGKSTFANLVPRFYEPTSGVIKYNDTDLRSLRKADLRAQIAIVSQDTVLFNDTIANNIRLSRPDASMQDVQAAANKAQAHDFITAMEQGYDTVVGERGTRLSGGQKQRIAIARAFLKNAPVLILDEATSALDSESEAKIQEALNELVKGKTVFIIAHRFSTIKLASRILVFENGSIIADGSHDELIEHNQLYRELHSRQS